MLGMVVLIVVAAGGGRRDTFKISFSVNGNLRTLIHLYSHSLFFTFEKTKFQGKGSFQFHGRGVTSRKAPKELFIHSRPNVPTPPSKMGRGKVRSPECARPVTGTRVRSHAVSPRKGKAGERGRRRSQLKCEVRSPAVSPMRAAYTEARGKGKGGELEAKTRSQRRSPAVFPRRAAYKRPAEKETAASGRCGAIISSTTTSKRDPTGKRGGASSDRPSGRGGAIGRSQMCEVRSPAVVPDAGGEQARKEKAVSGRRRPGHRGARYDPCSVGHTFPSLFLSLSCHRAPRAASKRENKTNIGYCR